jgi:hypothetical protein
MTAAGLVRAAAEAAEAAGAEGGGRRAGQQEEEERRIIRGLFIHCERAPSRALKFFKSETRSVHSTPVPTMKQISVPPPDARPPSTPSPERNRFGLAEWRIRYEQEKSVPPLNGEICNK